MKYEDWYEATHKRECNTVWDFFNLLEKLGIPWPEYGICARTISNMNARIGK